MIEGVVENRAARVEVDVFDIHGQAHRVLAVIDTGYNGDLTLPAKAVALLGLSFAGHRQARLADNSIVVTDVYRAFISWHGAHKEVVVSEMAGGVLIGMTLLANSRLTIDAIEGGRATIEELTGDVASVLPCPPMT